MEIDDLKHELQVIQMHMQNVQADLQDMQEAMTPQMQMNMQTPNTWPPAQHFNGGANQMVPGFQPPPQFYPQGQFQAPQMFHVQVPHQPAFNGPPGYHAQQATPATPTKIPGQVDGASNVMNVSPQTPTPQPAAQQVSPYNQAAMFNTKPTQELLHSSFAFAESAIRSGAIAPFHKNLATDQKARELFNACVRHLCNKKEVTVLLGEDEGRFCLIAGVLNQYLVEEIYRKDTLSEFPCDATNDFIKAWNAEYDVVKSEMCGNLAFRQSLMTERIEAALEVQNTYGFWKWVQRYIDNITGILATMMAPAIPHRNFANFRMLLFKAVNEAVRLTIRLRTEPNSTEFHCQKIGISWNSRYMVHRNSELIGVELRDDKPDHNTRCGIAPLVKQRYFKEQNEDPTVVHRGEVLVCHRSANLRMMRNHTYVHPMENFAQKRIGDGTTGNPGSYQFR